MKTQHLRTSKDDARDGRHDTRTPGRNWWRCNPGAKVVPAATSVANAAVQDAQAVVAKLKPGLHTTPRKLRMRMRPPGDRWGRAQGV